MLYGYDQFSIDAGAIRKYLVQLDPLAVNVRFSDHTKSSKAFCIVWLGASIEKFWKEYLKDLSAVAISASIYTRRRHLAIVGLHYFDLLGSLGEGKKLRRWERAIDFFDDLKSGNAVAANSLPYDGKTVRPSHIDLAWRLFSLTGSSFPSPIHRQELNTLADRRNDVAHGEDTPGNVGGAVSISDLQCTLSRLEDIVEHCVLAARNKWGG